GCQAQRPQTGSGAASAAMPTRVSGDLHAVAADRHRAPATPAGAGPIQEIEEAAWVRAALDLVARPACDQICDGAGDRGQCPEGLGPRRNEAQLPAPCPTLEAGGPPAPPQRPGEPRQSLPPHRAAPAP